VFRQSAYVARRQTSFLMYRVTVRRAALWLAVVGLTTNLLLPVFHQPATAAGMEFGGNARLIPICTSSGIRYIRWGPEEGAPELPDSSVPDCPICLFMKLHGVYLAPLGPDFKHLPDVEAERAEECDEQIVSGRIVRIFLARAPPSVV
jgi:hypothetical protein